MDVKVIKVKDLLVKEPFKRIVPDGQYTMGGEISEGGMNADEVDKPLYRTVTQADYLREWEVTGHLINNERYYPNKMKVDPDTKRVVMELVARCAFPFQYIITIKQLTHLCGNPIKFADSSPAQSEESKELLREFKQGWLDKNMEVAWFEAAKAEKVTGDCALCAYLDEGKFGWKVFSFLDGDILYPHLDSVTGRMNVFARRYSLFDDKDRETKQYVEVWDDHYLTRFVMDKMGLAGAINQAKDYFGLDGWKLVSQKPHGFPTCPIAYHRSRIGACWTPSQGSINNYELSVSQLCESNKKYAFPILFMRGGDIEVSGLMDGRPFAITSSDMNADAKILNPPDASSSFELQLKILLQNIFMGSFTVLPPEVKSGDLPGVAIKLIYSPAVEKAMEDAKEWNAFVDRVVELFRFGYGLELGKSSAYATLKVTGTIVPYVHQNEAEIFENLFKGVTGGFISKETASEEVPKGKSDEYKRLLKEARDLIIGYGYKETNPKDAKPANSGEEKTNL